MEIISLIRDSTNGNIKDPDNVSKSSHTETILASNDLLLINNEQETYKCDHFTIRGYVAEVCEREMKHCWPLFKLDNHTLEGHPNLVPPLPVKKFRRWNCQNCLNRAIALENVVEDGMIRNARNYDELQNDYRSSNSNAAASSHPPPVKYIASLPQQCKQKSPEEVPVENDSSIPGSNGECHSLRCLSQKDGRLQSSDSVKEGTTILRSGQDKSYEDQKQVSKKIVVAAGEVCQRGAGNIAVRSNTSKSSLIGKDATGILFSKRKETELIHGIADAQISGKMIASMIFNLAVSDETDDQGISEAVKGIGSSRNGVKDFLMPQGVDDTIQKDVPFPAICHPSRHDFKLNKSGHEATDTNLDIIDTLMVHSQVDAKERAGSVDGQQHKRGPKLRSIDEILRRCELRKTENAGLSSANAGTQDNHNGQKVFSSGGGTGSHKYTDRSGASKSKDENPASPRRHLVSQNEPSPKRKKDVLTNGDRCLKRDILTNSQMCLAHWHNKMARKHKVRKGNTEGKHTNIEVGKCKSASLKGLDLNVEYFGEKDEEEIIREVKHSTMADSQVIQSCPVFKEDELPIKGHTGFENLRNNDSHSENAHSKLSEIRIIDKDLNPCIETQENCDKMTLLVNKKHKRPRVEDGASSQAHWLKKQTAFELHNEGKKKQIPMQKSEQQAEDDIHMKIVELLAKMQHEERLISGMSDKGSIYNSLVMAESVKDGTTWGVEGTYESKVSDEMRWSIPPNEPQPSITEYNHFTTIRNDGEFEYTLKNYNSPTVSKSKHYIDLNQQVPISACTRCGAFSSSIGLSGSEDQLSSIDRNGLCSPLNSHWNGMEVLALCSQHKNHIASGHRPNSAHNGSSVLLNGTPVTNIRKLDVGFNYNGVYLRGIPEPVAHNAGYQIMVDMSGKRLLNCEGQPESSIKGLTSAAKTFGAVNGNHPGKMEREDSNANETISALNLLGLMDRAVNSGEVQQSSIHRIVGTTHHDQQAGNPGQPLRPVARVGILSPHLQQEIATTPNSSRMSLGFRSGDSSGHSFLMTNAMGKGEAFQSSTVTKTTNLSSSISRDVTSKRLPVGFLANPACSVASGDLIQAVNNKKNDTVQPIRSTDKMEECVVNRNPADFTMPEEYSEYMIEYKEPRTRRRLKSRNLQSPTPRSGKKRQKMIKIA